MPLDSSKIRVVLRWVHLILGLVLLCYIYAPFSQVLAFRFFVKFIAVPAIVLSGFWLWKTRFFNTLFKIK